MASKGLLRMSHWPVGVVVAQLRMVQEVATKDHLKTLLHLYGDCSFNGSLEWTIGQSCASSLARTPLA